MDFAAGYEVASASYSLDGQDNVTIQGKARLLGLAEGEHDIVVYAYDVVGNVGISNRAHFVVDTVQPSLDVSSMKSKTYSSMEIPLTFKVDETPSWVGYSLDGRANATIADNAVLFDLPIGKRSLVFYANNTAGNMGVSEVISFEVVEPFPFVLAVATASFLAVGAGLLSYRRKRRREAAQS